MSEVLHNIENNSAMLLGKSKGLLMAGLPAASSTDLLTILKEEQDQFDKANKQLMEAIVDELFKRQVKEKAGSRQLHVAADAKTAGNNISTSR